MYFALLSREEFLEKEEEFLTTNHTNQHERIRVYLQVARNNTNRKKKFYFEIRGVSWKKDDFRTKISCDSCAY